MILMGMPGQTMAGQVCSATMIQVFPGYGRMKLLSNSAATAVLALLLALLSACAAIPRGVEPVTDLEPERYLGTWYSIARLDHSFERHLTDVTARYEPREDGSITVINRGYHSRKEQWVEARGVARFVESPNVGRLKVSFFGPFFLGSYNIIALDRENYEYSMVVGPNRSYLWILARSPELDPQVIEALVAQAKGLDFATENLIFVVHERRP